MAEGHGEHDDNQDNIIYNSLNATCNNQSPDLVCNTIEIVSQTDSCGFSGNTRGITPSRPTSQIVYSNDPADWDVCEGLRD